jgi:GNAT superfamily N-acetyltransferase
LVRRVYSDTEYTRFMLDLTQELKIREAQIPFTLRKYEHPEPPSKFLLQEIIFRLPTLWVGVTEGGEICYSQGMAEAGDVETLRMWYPACPVPESDEVLVEGSYVPPRFRGRGIGTTGLALVAQEAARLGYSRVICHVASDNQPSMRAHVKAGFVRYETLTLQWRGFRSSDTVHKGPGL